jgi:hypothetical protein
MEAEVSHHRHPRKKRAAVFFHLGAAAAVFFHLGAAAAVFLRRDVVF